MAMHNISEYGNGQTYMVQGTESNQLIANPHFEQVESMYTEGAPEFLVDPGLYYPAATNYGYYCTGFGSPTDWEDHHKVFGADGPDIQFTGVQSESLPYVYYTPSYGYAESPYNPYNPYIPGAMIGVDGPFAGAQQYYTVPSYQNSGSSPAYIPVLVQPDLTSPETLLNIGGPSISRSDGRNLKNNFASPAGNYVRNSSKPSNQGNSVNREGPKDTNRQAIIYGSIPSGGIQNSTSSRAFQGRNASSSIQPVNSNYNGKVTTQRNQFKGALSDFGSDTHGWGSSEKTRSKFGFGRVQDSFTGSADSFGQQNRGPRTSRPKNELSVKAYTTKAGNVNAEGLIVIDTEQYNIDSFPVDYEDAKFFVIKSYSEDDVHKSIKYNVWSSTPHGNKKLQSAYDDAQRIAAGKSKGCPIFLFFSVNASGQFCGVAEMIGPVDFHKDMDFWQQDKWSGSFPVKWHFIKDVQNTAFRHIILENNENKPVTNSRDTQEVMRKQGLEMLKIYKNHTLRTSLLDDFMYYESRQKMMQEERARLLVRSFHTPFSVPAAAAAAAAATDPPPRKLMNNIIINSSNIGSETHRPRDNQHREVNSSLVGVSATSSSTQQQVSDVGGEKKLSPEQNEEKNDDDITSGLKIGSLTINPANIIHEGDPSTGVAKPKEVVTIGSLPINVNGYDETSSGSLTVGTIALDPRVLQQPDKESSPASSSSPSTTTITAATSTKTGVPKKLLMRPASAN